MMIIILKVSTIYLTRGNTARPTRDRCNSAATEIDLGCISLLFWLYLLCAVFVFIILILILKLTFIFSVKKHDYQNSPHRPHLTTPILIFQYSNCDILFGAIFEYSICWNIFLSSNCNILFAGRWVFRPPLLSTCRSNTSPPSGCQPYHVSWNNHKYHHYHYQGPTLSCELK